MARKVLEQCLGRGSVFEPSPGLLPVVWTSVSKEELGAREREVLKRVEVERQVGREHVYGYTGEVDNELANKLVEEGVKDKFSEEVLCFSNVRSRVLVL